MEREISTKLATWKNSASRLPLVLSGARQVGKTYALKHFGKTHFAKQHYLNFEDRKDLSLIFEPDLDVKRIISELELSTQTSIDLKHDIVILDEIQNCPRAITALKYFAENMPELAVCAAGSLLGVNLSEESFPVGKVDRLWLGPLNFKEFLLGVEATKEHKTLEEACLKKSISTFAHKILWEKFTLFAAIGGLPAAIKAFKEKKENLSLGLNAARKVQDNLIKDYLADIAKHSGKVNALHIQLVLQSVVNQLGKNLDGGAKKYVFKEALPNKKGYANFHGPISWLEKAGLIYKIKICNQPSLPIEAYCKDSVFKLYLFDTGLLGALSGIPISVLHKNQYGQTKGVFAENLALQLMVKDADHKIYSWQQNTSEIEFVKIIEEDIVPIEVKASSSSKAKSLLSYIRRYQPRRTILLGTGSGERDDKSWPIYFAGDL